MCVVWFDDQQDDWKTYQLIFAKLGGQVGSVPWKNPVYLTGDPDLDWKFFFHFIKIVRFSTIWLFKKKEK